MATGPSSLVPKPVVTVPRSPNEGSSMPFGLKRSRQKKWSRWSLVPAARIRRCASIAIEKFRS